MKRTMYVYAEIRDENICSLHFPFVYTGGDMLERDYQAFLIKLIKSLIPGCEVLLLDPNQIQGIPDLLILAPTGKWATLEVKASEKSKLRPNQEWYVQHWGEKAFSSFIYPENQEEVLHALQLALAG
jgi:hypothetical protein